MARGASASGPDRAPLGCQHLPARCGRGTGGRSDAGGRRFGVLRAPRHALERRDGTYVRHQHTGRSQAPAFRLAVRPERGSWPRPGRTVPGCHGRTDRAARRYTGGDRRFREHALVLASGTLTYSFEKLPGLRAMLATGSGMYLDRYVAQVGAGLLVLHGYGNVFERALGAGESILIDPGAFLYKDSSVTMEVVSVNFKANFEGAVGQAGAPGDGGAQGSETGATQPRRAGARARAGPSGPADPGGATGRRPFGRGLRGLKAAKSMLNVGALTSAAGNLRAGGGLRGSPPGWPAAEARPFCAWPVQAGSGSSRCPNSIRPSNPSNPEPKAMDHD